jgi:hypothetical protein
MANQTITRTTIALGDQYGNWLVRSAASRKGKHAFWCCECLSCGQESDVRQDNLVRGKSRKCRQCKAAFGNQSRPLVSADGTVRYRSIHEASRKLGVDRTTIILAIEQKRRIAGHIWQFKQPQEVAND